MGGSFRAVSDSDLPQQRTNRIFVSSVPPTMVLCGHTNKILVPILLFGIYKMSNKSLQRTLRTLAADLGVSHQYIGHEV